MSFDPDAYLQAKTAAAAPTTPAAPVDFNPDAYLAQKSQPTVSTGEAALEGLGQGLTFGWGDEMGAGLQAALAALTPGMSAAETYREARRDNRQLVDAARTQHKGAFTAAQVAGGLTSGIATAGLAGTSVPAVLGMSTAQGATQGLGEAAELDGQGLLRAGLGAGLGLASGGVGLGLGKLATAGMQRLNSFAGRQVAGAADEAFARGAQDIDDKIARAWGSAGGEAQKGNRLVENLDRLAPYATPEQAAKLKALEDAGVLGELREQLLGSNLADVSGQAAQMAAKRAEAVGMQEGREELIRAAQERMLSPAEALRQLGERANRYGPVAIGSVLGSGFGPVGALAGMAIGKAVDGAKGATGALAGAGLRPMYHALLRMVKHPSLRNAAFKPLQALTSGTGEALETAATAGASEGQRSFLSGLTELARTNPAALGAYARYFRPDAPEAEHALADYTLAQTDPAYAQMRRQVAQEGAAP